MKDHVYTMILISVVLLLADAYVFNGLRGGFKKQRFVQTTWFAVIYWILSVMLIWGTIVSIYVTIPVGIRATFLLLFFLSMLFKVCFMLFVVFDDIRRFFVWIKRPDKKVKIQRTTPKENVIPRSEFLMKAGLIAGAVPLVGLGFGILEGAYDYRVRYQTLYLPNLPKSFDGMKIGQISDIHSGSFYNKKAVQGGVEMLLKEKPEVIFFTGDLVNKKTEEVYGYQNIFSKVKAPLGVFSILGNHDYGDYANWPNLAAKEKNLQDLYTVHKNLGWDLLNNVNRRLKVNGEEIGILGVENWGAISRFPRYGRMDLAVKNTDDLPVKLLLSHDPSHWQRQVVPEYPQIDVMFSGHTHGMQMGVRTPGFQWSPVEYIYKEWAGLYTQGKMQLYVNVGYGFLGFPGRVGILPEITIFELRSSANPLANRA